MINIDKLLKEMELREIKAIKSNLKDLLDNITELEKRIKNS